MSTFLFRAPPEVLEFMVELADTMVALFGISREEAVGRINARWKDNDFPDDRESYLGHETFEFWAKDTYYGSSSYWWRNPDVKPLVYPWSPDQIFTPALYLRDLGQMLKAMALRAKREASSASDQERSFSLGRLRGLSEVVSLMQQHAVAFGMDASEVGLDGIDPDRDLL